MRKKVLMIAPHLSTGGFPQYFLWNIEQIIDSYDVYVVEYSFLSPTYVVQRNKVLKLISPEKFFSLRGDKSQLLSIIENINPDIIHWGDFPEIFCDSEITKQIYKFNRSYNIIETTHGSVFDPSNKQFFPDKFILVSEWSKLQYQKYNIPIDVIEYPIIKRIRDLNKTLGFNPLKKHVLNVGLFTPGKNQGEIFEIAKKIPEADFHFVGNLAENFRFYWEQFLVNKPTNCIIHGEQDDVDKFYNCADLFLFTTKFELNPICLKEAIGWGIPILMRNLPTYCNQYEGPFLTDNFEENVKLVRNKLYGV